LDSSFSFTGLKQPFSASNIIGFLIFLA
jgi:hypothetical protein